LRKLIEEIQAAYKADKEIRGQEAARIGASVLARVLEGAEGRVELAATIPKSSASSA
jgi:hypothetical protein